MKPANQLQTTAFRAIRDRLPGMTAHSAAAAIPVFAKLRPRLERDLAELIRPELQAAGFVDLLIVTESALRRRFEGLFGCTMPTARSLYLEEAGTSSHAAEGPAIVICDQTIVSQHARPAAALQRMIAIAVHEVAHIVQRPIRCEAVNVVDRQMLKPLMEFSALRGDEQAEFPFQGHDADFARLSIHLAARLRRRGWRFPDPYLWIPRTIDLSYANLYAAALQDEIKTAGNRSLSEIVQTPPPTAFSELFELDRRQATRKSEPMLNFLTRLRKRHVAQIETAEEKFRRIVAQGADAESGIGSPPDEGELLETLRTLSRSIDDFEAEVQQLIKRRELRAEADKEGPLRGQLESLEADFREKQTRHLEAQKAFNAACDKYTLEKKAINGQISQCERAKNELRKLTEPRFQERLSELDRRAFSLAQRGQYLRNESLPRLREIIADNEADLRRAQLIGKPHEIEQLTKMLTSRQQTLADDEATVEANAVEMREINSERNDIRRRMLEVE